MGIARLILEVMRSADGGGKPVTQRAEVGRVHVPGVGYLTVTELQRISSGAGEPRLGGRDGLRDEGLRDYDEWAEMGLPPAGEGDA